MARKDIDWSQVKLAPGGFWHSDGDGTKVLIGFGTHRGNKFVQQDNDQILTLIAAIPALVAGTGGTTDQGVQAILDAITVRFPAGAVTFEDVLNDPDGLGRRYFELVNSGMTRDDVLAQLTTEQAAA